MASPITNPRFFGVIDEDPFHFDTWSGSSRFFFQALQEKRLLVGATGTEPSGFAKALLRSLNFRPTRAAWRFAYHTDARVFRARTKVAKRAIAGCENPPDCILQIGAWYDMTETGLPTVSYHDGNLARRLNSPYGHPRINQRHLRKAWEYERSLYERLDFIFPMSEWLMRSFIKDFGVREDKLRPVFAGVNLPEVLTLEPPAYDDQHVLFVGKDFRRKGGHDLMNAFRIVKRRFPNARLTLVGPSQKITGDGICNLGPITKDSVNGIERIRSIYRSASVFVMPTLYEPFGIAFAEAMAHGLPCVGTHVCAVPELIVHRENGLLVSPGCPSELANAICDMLSDPGSRRQLGQRGFDRYLKDFRWSRVVSKISGEVRRGLK